MLSFEEAGQVLDEAVDALPAEIFDKLYGGVNLVQEKRASEDGLLTMGMYIVGPGRRVEIYYGSFAEALAAEDDETWRRELVATLKHELTHHMENLAGDRSLEKWDEQHREELLSGAEGEPLRAQSILFVSGDDAGLGPIAEGFFAQACQKAGCSFPCESAGLRPAAAVSQKAVRAAADYGADISQKRPQPVTEALMERYEAALCMRMEDAQRLAERFPRYEERILCLGPQDLDAPRLGTRGAWSTAAERVAVEIDYLVAELREQPGGEAEG